MHFYSLKKVVKTEEAKNECKADKLNFIGNKSLTKKEDDNYNKTKEENEAKNTPDLTKNTNYANTNQSKEDYENPVKNLNFGFVTGAGKSVNISRKAMLNAQRLLKNDALDKNDYEIQTKNISTNNKNAHNMSTYSLKSKSTGFLTASGDTVNVSDIALADAESIFSLEASNSAQPLKIKSVGSLKSSIREDFDVDNYKKGVFNSDTNKKMEGWHTIPSLPTTSMI